MMQTSGPKAKLLTNTMVEEEMVDRCSGERKSPTRFFSKSADLVKISQK